jgi:hypothetical protein
MRRVTPLVLFAFVVVLSASGLAAVGCGNAPSVSVSSATATTSKSTTEAVAASTTNSRSPVATAARTITEQQQRFAVVSDLAQHHGWAAIDYKTPQSPDWDAELIVYGTVVKVDPARWNSPDGRQPVRDDNPIIYSTFYVQPTKVMGTPRFGTPIAIMVPYHDELLAEGDEVLVFAEYGEVWGPGTWKRDAYFSEEEVRGIYMKVGEQYLNLDSGQPLASAETSDQEGTAQAEAALQAFFKAWGAKDLAAYKTLLSERRLQDMKLGDWTFADLDHMEFGPVIPAPEVIDHWIAAYGHPYRGDIAKEDVRCFRASVAWYNKPGVEGPTANGEELPWMWFLVRGTDGKWRVDDWGA